MDLEPAGESGDPVELAVKYDLWACREAIGYWVGVNRFVEKDELVGAGRLGLWKAALKYRCERGVPFCGYARNWLWSEFNEVVRRAVPLGYRRPRLAGRTQPVIERMGSTCDVDVESGDDGPVQVLIAAEGLELLGGLWERVRQVLSAREFDMLVARFLDGEEYEAIAARHGVSRQRVYQIVHRALKYSRELLEKDGRMSGILG